MLIRGDLFVFQRSLVLITLMAASVFATATSAAAQRGFFSVGDAYERFIGKWSRELAPLLVKFAGVRNGDAVLDVGSGTGALTAAVAAVARSSRIIGINPAAPYVAFAQTRHPGDLVRFEVGDAQWLRFLDGSFDRTLSLLVLNFIADPAQALDQMIRVTRPGGTVAAAVWDYGQEMEMLRVFWGEAVALDPAAAARDERHMPLCRKGELDVLWRKHRLLDVSEEALTIRTRFSTFDDYWSPFLDKQGPAGAYIAALAASDREQLRLRLRRRLTTASTACLDNLSMWEWYAAKQTGYCLEFSKAGLFVDVRDVAYEPPPLYDLTDLSNATSSSWFFYKYRDWSNEEEVRLVLPRLAGGPIFILDPQILTRVILGEDMTEANSGRIREWGQRRDPPVPVVTAKWDTVRSEFVVR